MKEKRVKLISRRRRTGRKNGKDFPRSFIKTYEGNTLSFRRPRNTIDWIETRWRLNFSIEKFINKYVGKEYDLCLSELRKRFIHIQTDLWESPKKCLNSYIDTDKEHSYRHFYLDNEGFIQRKGEMSRKFRVSKPLVRLSKEQLKHNKSRIIPDFNEVAKPWAGDSTTNSWFCNLLRVENWSSPKFINEYYIIYKDKVLLIPVYHMPGNAAGSFIDSSSGWNDTPGNYIYRKKQYLKEYWEYLPIRFSNNYYWQLYSTEMQNHFVHNHYKEILNPDYIKCMKNIENNDIDKDFWLKKLKGIEQYIVRNVGYGRLHPLIKKSDLQRIYEETN